MKKFLLLLAAVGMIFTACEPANGLDEGNNGNQTEQPGDSGSQGGDDNTGGEDNPDNPGGGDQGGEDNPDNPGSDQGGEDAVFIVTPTSCTVPASGGKVSLTLKYNVEDDYLQCGWCDEAGNEIDWIELIDVRTNTMYLTFSVAENTSSKKRTGYIILYDAKNDKYQEVAVEQKGKQNEEEVVFFVTPTSCTVPASGGKVSLTLKYDVADDYLQCGLCDEAGNEIDWIELIDTRTNTMYLTFSVAENTSSNKRIGYIILYDTKNNKEQKVTVTQEGKQNVVFEVSPSAITMSANGGTQNITVNTNIDYNVGCSASWVSCTKTTTGVKVTVAKSTSSQERTADIKLTNTSYNVSKVVKVTQSGAEDTPADKTQAIKFLDNNAKLICVLRWDENGDGELSYEEAAAVTGLGTIFKGSAIMAFDELKYFTGLTNIAESGFKDCVSLVKISLPEQITAIGKEAFSGCTNLKNIAIPDKVTSIEEGTFYGCNRMTSATIGNSVTSIGVEAFRECASLTSVTIPNSVTVIGRYAFFDCSSLTSITIGNSVTLIEMSAFEYCSSLTSITIPDSVNYIGRSAFFECRRLYEVYCKPTTPPTADVDPFAGWNAFNTGTERTKIYVPSNSVGAYKSAKGWSGYSWCIEGYNF